MQLKRFLKRGLIAAGLFTAGVVMASDGALLEAVRKGQLQQVQQLLEQGAALDGRGLDGSSPLLVATRDNRIDIARALIEAGISAVPP